MKIVIAAWHLKNLNVGIGRYARELIEALGRVDQTNQYEILIPHREHPFTARSNMRFRLIRFPRSTAGRTDLRPRPTIRSGLRRADCVKRASLAVINTLDEDGTHDGETP